MKRRSRFTSSSAMLAKRVWALFQTLRQGLAFHAESLALDASATWTRDFLRNLLITQQL